MLSFARWSTKRTRLPRAVQHADDGHQGDLPGRRAHDCNEFPGRNRDDTPQHEELPRGNVVGFSRLPYWDQCSAPIIRSPLANPFSNSVLRSLAAVRAIRSARPPWLGCVARRAEPSRPTPDKRPAQISIKITGRRADSRCNRPRGTRQPVPTGIPASSPNPASSIPRPRLDVRRLR